jgi:hypothetical protein
MEIRLWSCCDDCLEASQGEEEAPVALKVFLADTRDVERGIGHDEIEPAAFVKDPREELFDVNGVGVWGQTRRSVNNFR